MKMEIRKSDIIFLVLLVVTTVLLFIFGDQILALSRSLNEWTKNVGVEYGYIGIFIACVIGNGTIIIPIPYALIIVFFATNPNFDPLLLGLVAGFGSAIGEITSYALGRGVGKIGIESKYSWELERLKTVIENKTFFVIFLFGLTPLPDDIIMIPVGIIGYNFKKAILACALGKIILSLFLAYGGHYGAQVAESMFGESNPLSIIVTTLAIIVIAYLTIRTDWSSLLKRIKPKEQK